MRKLSLAMACLTIAAGLGFRWFRVVEADLRPEDLAIYEARPYGVDLPQWYSTHPYFLLWSRGDGQAFVTLAADLLLEGPAHGLAAPNYRFSRVGYAWLARLVAVGRIDWIPIGLFLVNVGALASVGWLSGTLAAQRRWGAAALLAANPGIYIAFASDTAEAAGAALAGAVVLSARVGSGFAAAFLVGLVRPELGTVLPTRPFRPREVTAAAAAAALLVRFIGVLAFPGDRRFAAAALGPPFLGYLEAWPRQRLLPALGASAVLVAGLVAVYVGMRHRRGWSRLAWIATGSLIFFLSSNVLMKPDNYLRAAVAFPVLWLDRHQPRSSAST